MRSALPLRLPLVTPPDPARPSESKLAVEPVGTGALFRVEHDFPVGTTFSQSGIDATGILGAGGRWLSVAIAGTRQTMRCASRNALGKR